MLFPIAGRIGSRVISADFDRPASTSSTPSSTAISRSLGDVLYHLALPALTLGITLSGVFVRLTRANMLDVLKSDYVLAARARGVPERPGRLQARAQERAHPHRDDARPPVQRPPRGRDPDRDDLFLAGHGQAPPGAHLPSRLSGHPGRHHRVRPIRQPGLARRRHRRTRSSTREFKL